MKQEQIQALPLTSSVNRHGTAKLTAKRGKFGGGLLRINLGKISRDLLEEIRRVFGGQ